MSVMEMSHRGPEFMASPRKAEADLRTLLAIPTNYRVLFLQGGAIAENAIVPMNLLGESKRRRLRQHRRMVEEVDQGGEEVHAGQRRRVGEDRNFSYVPPRVDLEARPDAAYVHVCTNETIGGVEYHWTPDTGAVPLVADMSSHILSRPIDVSKYGVIYAGAQKNVGPAGLTLVIVREDLLDRALPMARRRFHWKEQAERTRCSTRRRPTRSTSPGWCSSGCCAGRARRDRAKNIAKAQLLYDAIDASELYHSPVRARQTARA